MGLSFWAMSGFLSGMVGDYLLEERLSAERVRLGALAERLAPSLRARDADALDAGMRSFAAETGGRLILTDSGGKVQADTAGAENGRLYAVRQVIDILAEGRSQAYAVRDTGTGEEVNMSGVLFTGRTSGSWESVCAAPVVYDSAVQGVLVLLSPADAIMRSVYQLQDRLLLVFAAIATVVMLLTFIFSRVVTNPIAGLTRGIRHMSKGDFSSRVKVTGSREMAQLANAFNSMSEKLETLDQSRNQFVSNASHELKTPLTTMKIMVETLIYQPEMDKDLRTEFLTDIDNEIDRLSNIVSDLLTLVKMDSKDVKLQRENLTLAGLCRETEHRLAPIAAKKDQRIILALSDPCELYGDKSKLTQVVYNLVENAVKYTQAGGVIRVQLTRTGHEGHLVVQDNGPGIPRDSLPHIFDRFYRVDKARSRDTGGTGLGLSIVRQLVMLHDGSIRCESVEGKGTSFIVDIPLHQG